ncbi:hypothetical protein ACO0SA_004068 [Hanseniaspora valbyensis]
MANPIKFVGWFVKTTYIESQHNRYNLLTLILNFCINFFPVFLWLYLFKQAKSIPTKIRPKINGQWLFYSDITLLGGDFWNEQGSETITTISFLVSWVMVFFGLLIVLPYKLFQRTWTNAQNSSFKIYNFIKPYHLLALFFITLNFLHIFTKQEESNFKSYKDFITWFSYVLLHLIAPIVTAVFLYIYKPPGTMGAFALTLGIQNTAGFLTHVCLPSAPPWFTHMYGMHMTEELASELNYDTLGYAAGLTRMPFKLGTNLANVGFKKSPIVFGAVPSLHGAMALQCGLWIFYKYGANLKYAYNIKKTPNDDKNLCVTSDEEFLMDDLELNEDGSNGIQTVKSTNSGSSNTCSDMSDEILPVEEKSKWWWHTGRVLAVSYMLLQWFSTMYLDHHYRIDLFIGGIYAIISFHIVRVFVMEKNYDSYLQIADSNDKECVKRIDLSSKVWWFNEYGVLARYKLKQIEPIGDREEMSIGERVFKKYDFHKIFRI